MQVTHYQDDEVVIVCSGKSKLAGRAMLHKDELMSLQWVSLFKSSTVQAIKTTLEREGINWKAMKVVLVSASRGAACHAAAACIFSSHSASTLPSPEGAPSVSHAFCCFKTCFVWVSLREWVQQA